MKKIATTTKKQRKEKRKAHSIHKMKANRTFPKQKTTNGSIVLTCFFDAFGWPKKEEKFLSKN